MANDFYLIWASTMLVAVRLFPSTSRIGWSEANHAIGISVDNELNAKIIDNGCKLGEKNIA